MPLNTSAPSRLFPGWLRLIAFSAAIAAAGCSSTPPGRAIQSAVASTSHLLCSGVFISGRDPDQAYREEMRPEGGMGLLDWGLHYQVDRAHREVKASFAGLYESRAVYRDGLGCLVVHGAVPETTLPSALAQPAVAAPPDDIAGPDVVEPKDDRLRRALDHAFAEPAQGPLRYTKAVVVVHHGQVIAERYAQGVGIDTPWHGHSVSKTLTQALVGILVRQGRLDAGGRAAVPEWAQADDPRRAITVDELLRMSSGLPADEYAGGWDPASRMWHIERDMYAFAVQGELEAAPGTRWNYSNRGYMVLSRLLRDAAGGSADKVAAWMRHELFEPVGMRHATVEFDATDTPLGAAYVYASARDWARFGLLYLHDGMAGGRRVLPEGWVHASLRPTLDTGYGAGLWLNTVHTAHPAIGHWGLAGAPADAFYARGYLGQYVIVVPSRDLVIVRLGVSHAPDGDLAGVGRLVEEVVAALTRDSM